MFRTQEHNNQIWNCRNLNRDVLNVFWYVSYFDTCHKSYFDFTCGVLRLEYYYFFIIHRENVKTHHFILILHSNRSFTYFRKEYLKLILVIFWFTTSLHLLDQVNNENTRIRHKSCTKLITKTQAWLYAVLVSLLLTLVLPLLTLNKLMSAEHCY